MKTIELPTECDRHSKRIVLEDDDWKEIFSLFTSCTEHEKNQVYDRESPHYYKNVELLAEYTYTAEKKEYAIDAWRAVLSFLHTKGWRLTDGRNLVDLSMIEEEFLSEMR